MKSRSTFGTSLDLLAGVQLSQVLNLAGTPTTPIGCRSQRQIFSFVCTMGKPQKVTPFRIESGISHRNQPTASSEAPRAAIQSGQGPDPPVWSAMRTRTLPVSNTTSSGAPLDRGLRFFRAAGELQHIRLHAASARERHVRNFGRVDHLASIWHPCSDCDVMRSSSTHPRSCPKQPVTTDPASRRPMRDWAASLLLRASEERTCGEDSGTDGHRGSGRSVF